MKGRACRRSSAFLRQQKAEIKVKFMANKSGNISSIVEELVRPTVEGLGYTLWDVEYVKEGATWYLRITIDSDQGVDLDGCERVHRAIDPVLDSADPIEDPYYLEVSSPGLERNIRTREHFLLCRGETVQIRLYKPINGTKSFVGVLDTDQNGDLIIIRMNDGSTQTVERKAIAKANVYFQF